MPTSDATLVASTTVLVLMADNLACMLLLVKFKVNALEALFSFATFLSAGGGILQTRTGPHQQDSCCRLAQLPSSIPSSLMCSNETGGPISTCELCWDSAKERA